MEERREEGRMEEKREEGRMEERSEEEGEGNTKKRMQTE